MCRLFGFRSVTKSQVHNSLVEADNALIQQSNAHPDGWGVAFYIDGAAQTIRSLNCALRCQLFQKVSGLVKSHAVIAHVRKATKGAINTLNTHPFQYGLWTFAHNGNIRNFKQFRETFRERIHPQLRGFVFGNTDSEMIFFMILSRMFELGVLDKKNVSRELVLKACRLTIAEIVRLAGPLTNDEQGDPDDNYLTFLLTNGQFMLGFQGGKDLYYSSHKVSCHEKDSCAHYQLSCENAVGDGQKLSHLIFCSEPPENDNIWQRVGFQGFVGCDENMRLILA